MSLGRRRIPRLGGALALVAALALLSGCATYSSRTAALRPQLAAGDFDAALKTIDEGTGSHDRLLTLLERGLVLHYADRWEESNEVFSAAELLAEDLYTKSVSQGVASLVSSDESIDYRARPYELAMVPYYKALNYEYLGLPRESVVEARRAEELQAAAVEATLGDVREADRADLARIRIDPFLLWFAGMLREQAGETNDAFVSYRNAAVAFQDLHDLLEVEPPDDLARDLARTARRLGFTAELEQVRKDCPVVFRSPAPDPQEAETGRVVVLLETGYVPQKTQIRFDFPVYSGKSYDDTNAASWDLYNGAGRYRTLYPQRKIEYWVSVAAPELQDALADPLARCRVAASDCDTARYTVVATNLSRAARITFDAEKPTIFFKTILRGLTKYLAQRGLEKSTGKVGGLLANIFGAVTEKADTRSWSTLPGRILVARLDLPPGRHDLQVELLDKRDHVRGVRTIAGVEVRPGGWTFVSRRLF